MRIKNSYVLSFGRIGGQKVPKMRRLKTAEELKICKEKLRKRRTIGVYLYTSYKPVSFIVSAVNFSIKYLYIKNAVRAIMVNFQTFLI